MFSVRTKIVGQPVVRLGTNEISFWEKIYVSAMKMIYVWAHKKYTFVPRKDMFGPSREER